jgi:ABC-type iron transport system FetAB ATPase subunit
MKWKKFQKEIREMRIAALQLQHEVRQKNWNEVSKKQCVNIIKQCGAGLDSFTALLDEFVAAIDEATKE